MTTKEALKNEVEQLYLHGQAFEYYMAIKLDCVDEEVIELAKGLEHYQDLTSRLFDDRYEYQEWYFKCCNLLEQLAPNRYKEFTELYTLENMPEDLNIRNYTISDFFSGIQVIHAGELDFNPFAVFRQKFEIQLSIIRAISRNMDSLITDIEGAIQRSFFDTELSEAEVLYNDKHFRASGVICGVVLEKHLTAICDNHGISFERNDPGIEGYNNGLRSHLVIDKDTSKHITRLGGLRNKCAHNTNEGPTKADIEELISGCKRIIAEVY